MVVSCQIEFDQNLLGTFYAGQLVSGTVILKADKPKDVQAVQLKLCGFASTVWTERAAFHSVAYAGYEDYLSSVTYLVGSAENSKHTIPMGVHSYQFACQLPYNCPSSFEGRDGRVRYYVRVVLIRPWKMDQNYTRGFTVLKTLDLNYDTPQLKLPANTTTYRSFCCRPCKSKPLQLKLELPRTGYVPGEHIPVHLLVINNTGIAVAEVTFSLIMVVRYFSTTPSRITRMERIKVSEAPKDRVLKKCTRSFNRQLKVPSTPPTSMTLSSLVQIAYHVHIDAKMKGFYGTQMISIPIIIGNVPLWQHHASRLHNHLAQASEEDLSARTSVASSQHPQQHSAELTDNDKNKFGEQSLNLSTISGSIQSVAMIRSPTQNGYPNMPPPTYEEAVHTERADMRENNTNDYGISQFIPLYPVFDLSTISDPTDMIVVEEDAAYYNESYIE